MWKKGLLGRHRLRSDWTERAIWYLISTVLHRKRNKFLQHILISIDSASCKLHQSYGREFEYQERVSTLRFFIGPHIRRRYWYSSQEAESREISISCKNLFLNRCKINKLYRYLHRTCVCTNLHCLVCWDFLKMQAYWQRQKTAVNTWHCLNGSEVGQFRYITYM